MNTGNGPKGSASKGFDAFAQAAGKEVPLSNMVGNPNFAISTSLTNNLAVVTGAKGEATARGLTHGIAFTHAKMQTADSNAVNALYTQPNASPDATPNATPNPALAQHNTTKPQQASFEQTAKKLQATTAPSFGQG